MPDNVASFTLDIGSPGAAEKLMAISNALGGVAEKAPSAKKGMDDVAEAAERTAHATEALTFKELGESVEALGRAVKESLHFFDEITEKHAKVIRQTDKWANLLQVSGRELEAFGRSAEAAGAGGVLELAGALEQFRFQAVKADMGQGRMKPFFDALHLSAKDGAGKAKSSIDLYVEAFEKIRHIPDQQVGNTLARVFMGQPGLLLLNQMREKNAGPREILHHEMGLNVLTDEQRMSLDKLARVNHHLEVQSDRLGQMLAGVTAGPLLAFKERLYEVVEGAMKTYPALTTFAVGARAAADPVGHVTKELVTFVAFLRVAVPEAGAKAGAALLGIGRAIFSLPGLIITAGLGILATGLLEVANASDEAKDRAGGVNEALERMAEKGLIAKDALAGLRTDLASMPSLADRLVDNGKAAGSFGAAMNPLTSGALGPEKWLAAKGLGWLGSLFGGKAGKDAAADAQLAKGVKLLSPRERLAQAVKGHHDPAVASAAAHGEAAKMRDEGVDTKAIEEAMASLDFGVVAANTKQAKAEAERLRKEAAKRAHDEMLTGLRDSVNEKKVAVEREALSGKHAQDIAAVAVLGLTRDGFTKDVNHCVQWVRQVVEHAQGEKDRALSGKLFGGDAPATQRLMEKAGLMLKPGEPLRPGDILLKSNHAGIYIGDGKVAENSSAHVHNGDARGIRDLKDFGPYRAARLPQSLTPAQRDLREAERKLARAEGGSAVSRERLEEEKRDREHFLQEVERQAKALDIAAKAAKLGDSSLLQQYAGQGWITAPTEEAAHAGAMNRRAMAASIKNDPSEIAAEVLKQAEERHAAEAKAAQREVTAQTASVRLAEHQVKLAESHGESVARTVQLLAEQERAELRLVELQARSQRLSSADANEEEIAAEAASKRADILSKFTEQRQKLYVDAAGGKAARASLMGQLADTPAEEVKYLDAQIAALKEKAQAIKAAGGANEAYLSTLVEIKRLEDERRGKLTTGQEVLRAATGGLGALDAYLKTKQVEAGRRTLLGRDALPGAELGGVTLRVPASLLGKSGKVGDATSLTDALAGGAAAGIIGGAPAIGKAVEKAVAGALAQAMGNLPMGVG